MNGPIIMPGVESTPRGVFEFEADARGSGAQIENEGVGGGLLKARESICKSARTVLRIQRVSRSRLATSVLLFAAFGAPLNAQDEAASKPAALTNEAAPKPAALTNEGKPMIVPYSCNPDDMQWAGMSCSEREPCPIYLDLTSVETAGNQIFLTGNLHNRVTTLYSILLASPDGGKTWSEPFDRLRGTGLDHIQFYDFESGWVSGQVVYPLSQDPFLLITTDGGKSWRRQAIFGESAHGTILQFGFTSKTTGSLVVDRGQSSESSRYARYESPNGGETWMIREASDRPIRIPRAAAGNPNWRIRPDGATQAFRIERQQGQTWSGVAAFLVRVASCQPAESQLAEPPQPVEEPEPEAAPPPPAPRKKPTLKRP
jgi:hypothetical protein